MCGSFVKNWEIYGFVDEYCSWEFVYGFWYLGGKMGVNIW